MKEWIGKNIFKIILIGGLIIAVIIILKQCKSNDINKKKLAVAEHNINALNDTIRVNKNKAGEVEYNKLVFLTDKLENLEKLNTNLYNEVKKIKGNASTIIKGETKIVTDTLYLVSNTVINQDTITTKFNFDTLYSEGNGRSLAGFTEYNLATKASRAQLTKDNISLSFTTGIKNLDKNAPEIFLTSNYPNFQVVKLDGAVLDKNLFKGKAPRKLSFGVQLGYSPLSYNFSTKKLGITNQITFGIGASYRIF